MLNPQEELIPYIESLKDDYEILWVNQSRKAEDWKVKIFKHVPSGLHLAVYDRKRSVIRLETDLPEIEGIEKLKSRPKSSAFNSSFPCFQGDSGFCFEVKSIDAFKKALSIYLSLELKLTTIQELEEELREKVNKSIRDGKAARGARLKSDSVKPKKYTVQITVFDRNPDVIAEVLERANGKCEICGRPAPFNRKKDGSPYLEVHHKVQLAAGGDDSVENALAVCPNCHREQHYG